MMKTIDKIAIGMACYKPVPEYFRLQLESIENQTFNNWICVLSFDSDIAEIRSEPSLQKYFESPKFIFVQNKERRGVLKNFEVSLHKALEVCPEMDAFGFCDQDDVWYPEKMAKSRALLLKLPPKSAVHTNSRLIFSNDGKTQTSTLDSWSSEQRGTKMVSLSQLTIRNVAAGASTLMDADLAKTYKDIPGQFTEYDWWFSCAAAAHGGLHPVEGPQYDYRQHGNNVLGISPYTGFFSLKKKDAGPDGVNFHWMPRLEETFRLLNLRYVLLRDAGFQFSALDRMAFSASFYDAGLGLILKGIRALSVDRPLARACLVRAVGKNIFFWRRLFGKNREVAV